MPRGSVRRPDCACSVTSNGAPGAFTKSEMVRYSSVPFGSPPGSATLAPKRIASSRPAAGFAVPSGLTLGWNGT